MQLVLIATCLVTGTTAAALALRTSGRSRHLLAYGAFAVTLGAGALTWRSVSTADAAPGNPVSAALAVGYLEFTREQPTTLRRQPATTNERLGSVPEMIVQLESRMKREPADVKGWSLLAKSYAYIGDEAGVELAVANAVRLGLEENALRAQIAAVRPQR